MCCFGFFCCGLVDASQAPLARTTPVELRAEDPVLDGHGPARTFEYTADFTGTLHIWTSGADLDCCLRVEREGGLERKDDDDSGGGTTPFVYRAVEPGMKLLVTVAASKPGTAGASTLHYVAAPETDATRAAAADATRVLGEVDRLRSDAKLDDARALLDVAVRDLLDVVGADASSAVVMAAYAAGRAARGLQDWPTARVAWAHFLAHRSRVLPPDHYDIQLGRVNLAVAAWMLNDFQAARVLQEQAHEVWTRTLPDEHPDLQSVRHDFASTLYVLGDLHGARALQEHALEVSVRTLPDEHPHVQSDRGGLALTLHDLGDLHGARELQERVLEVYTRTLPEDDIELQSARQSLAISMMALGDAHGARELFEQALAGALRTLPEDHIDVQRTRGNLAKVKYTLGDVRGARDLFEQMCEVLARTLPEDHPDLLRSRGNLATMLRELGEQQAAREVEEQVLDVYTRTLPADNPDLHRARINLASTMFALGDRQRARPLQDEALAGYARTLPEGHPDLLFVQEVGLQNLVCLEAEHDAVELANTLVAGLAASVESSFAKLSPREMEERVETSRAQLSLLLSLARGCGVLEPNAELDRAVFTRVESARSIGLVGAAIEAQVGKDDEIVRLNQAEQRQSSELARMAETGASREELQAARRDLDGLRRARVARLGAQPATQALLAEPTVDALAAKLAAHEAIVTFWRYWRFEVNPEKPWAMRRRDELLAYVLRKDALLARVELGTIEEIQDAVARWRAAVNPHDDPDLGARGRAAEPEAPSSASMEDAGNALRKRLVDPLRPALGDARHLIVALDDALHAVSLEALPWERGLLGERFTIEQHLSLRELLWSQRPDSANTAMIALGGASFDKRPASRSSASTTATDTDDAGEGADSLPRVEWIAQLRGSEWERGFTPLPHTGAEARAAADLYQRAFGADAIVLEGAYASRESIERLAPSARYVHLATHGWFKPAPNESTAGSGTTDSGSSMTPMLLCGLAFAGANLAQDALGDAPAVLTAEELASFDLSSCELAVLSACDTNVGVRRAGQGVASLQRALHMAGARSVITSLWKVPDEATKELMVDFYRRLWIEKKPKHQALWEAKTKLREAKDERGVLRYTTRDWAAWVLTGDPD
jgi:CHAT domain-containing protein/tetratricopeptide (TPR) repeat protein